ncbi:MAG: hypothetical protein JRI23_15000 [Deltaproteobacteria bacterium]|jgi:hypothetical protein|nr:hypothetical protein [Deltaproteobacteria bacterium]MBW2533058.1 hypothetical protein [Deltaproteobacteria bacterium]
MVCFALAMGQPAGTADRDEARVEIGHYAWITAALAEGFGLAEVLRIEGLERDLWNHAELAWRTRLATEPTVQDDYRTHLAEAEDELGGQVTPLGDDLEAWVLFLKIYGDHEAPFELLAEQRLRPGDLARLQRKWANRLEADDKLVERAGELRERVDQRAAEGEQLVLPDITVTLRPLKPSPFARTVDPDGAEPTAVEQPAARAAAADDAPQISLYDYAALCAALDDEGADEEAVLGAYGFSLEEGRRLHRAWTARMRADPALAADFRTLHRHFNEREGFRGEIPESHGYIPAARPVVPVAMSPVVSPPSSPPPAPSSPPSAPPAAAANVLPPEQRPGYNPELGMTLEGVAHVPRVALPFSKSKKQSAPPPSAAERSAHVPPEQQPDYNPDLGRTAGIGARVPKLTLPFKALQEAAATAGKAGARDGESEAKAAETTATEPRAGGSTSPSAPPAPIAKEKPKKKPGYNVELAQTAKVGARVPHITLPFQAKQGTRPARDSLDANVPGDVAARLAARDPLPRGFASPARERDDDHPKPNDLAQQVEGWQVNHYASLCAELAEQPDQTAAIRRRYGVPDDAAEQQVHEHWHAKFVEDVETRKEWQRLLKEYREALARQK